MATRSHRRRKQVTAALLAGCILCACGLKAAEPEAAAATAAADEQAARLRAALNKPISVSWNDVSLEEAIKKLQADTGVTIVLDTNTLKDAGTYGPEKLNCVLRDLPLRYALLHILKPLELAYVPRGEVLLITTPDRATSELVVRVYDVLDLIKLTDDATEEQLDYDSLIELITNVINPITWDEVGGPSSICPGFGCLTISQTAETHETLVRVLAALRRSRNEDARQNYQPIAVEDPTLTKIHSDIEKVLSKPCKLDFHDVPLSNAMTQLASDTGLNILIDGLALENDNIPLDVPVTFQASDLSLRAALQLMLDRYSLKAVISQGVLWISTPDACQREQTTVVYPVGDLVPRPGAEDRTPICPGGMYSTQSIGCFYWGDGVIELITTALEPATWNEVGGPGMISPFPAGRCIAVTQTRDIHRKIERWLCDQRNVLKEREQAGVSMPKPSTAPATQVYEQMRSKDSPVSYEEQRDNAREAITLITSTIAPDRWQSTPDQYIVQVGSSIVVRNDPATLRKVSGLLFRLGFRQSGMMYGIGGFGDQPAAPNAGNNPQPPGAAAPTQPAPAP